MTKKLNTAVICFADGGGGMDMSAIKLAQQLVPYTEITIITRGGTFIEKQSFQHFNNIALHAIDFHSNFSLTLIIKVRKIIQNKKIKNVVFFGTREMKSLYFAFLKNDINLIMVHGTTRSTSKKNWFYKFLYQHIKYHVSISKHIVSNTLDIFPFGAHSQSKLIYNSVDVVERPYKKSNKLTLLHLGRVVHGKGQTDAITACEVLEKNNIDFRLNIVGELKDGYRKELLKFYNTCKYKNKIKFMCRSDNIYEYFENADIFLCPSYGEGLGNVFLEAFSTNIEVICYNNTVFPEFKALGFKFEAAEHLNIQDLKSKLLKVAQNLPKKRTTNNSSLARKIFSKQIKVDNYLQILQ